MAQQWHATGKTFLITGGASGLGAAYAEIFLSKGAKGIAILDISEDAGNAQAERLNQVYNGKTVFIKCDVTKEDDITHAFESVVSRFQQIDVIINNAGIMSDAPSVWRTASDVNWQGVVSFTLKGIKHMRKDEGGAGGTIINISSTAALIKFPFLPVYNGSKIAVLHFSQSLSVDPFFENTNIRMLTICFGPTDTPLLHNLETRGYDSSIGRMLAETTAASGKVFQKVESAVAAFVHMIEYGSPGTIWLSVDNKPVQDITPIINNVFNTLEKLVISQ